MKGILVAGIIDTGSDITIVRGDLFYHIVETTGLGKSSLTPGDLKACTYHKKPISYFGWTDGPAH